jgi:hypothetical protein
LESSEPRQIAWTASNTGGDRLFVRTGNGLREYDLSHAYRPGEAPLHAFRVESVDFTMRGDGSAMFVSAKGVATLDLSSGCLRTLEGVQPEPKAYGALEAIDAAHGRFFLVTDAAFIRVEADTMQVAAQVPRPSLAFGRVAYDPALDVVVVRALGASVHLYDASTLAEKSSFDLPLPPTLGPWVRPGHAEAIFGYEVPCAHRVRRASSEPTKAGPPCADPPDAWGARLARVDLRSGKILRVDAYGKGHVLLDEGDGTSAGWSGDGERFVVASWWMDPEVVGISEPPRPFRPKMGDKPYTWHVMDYRGPFVLGPTGDRFATSLDGRVVRVGSTVTGETLWSVSL